MKTAVVEKESLGGICLNWGCIPTKALLKSASVFSYINHAAEFEISVGEAKPDLSAMIKHSRDVADGMSKGVKFQMKKNNIDVLEGLAHLKAGRKIEVTDQNRSQVEYSANHIIRATGARSRSMPAFPQDGQKIIGYREVLSLEELPDSMVVVGSGAIGTEFAYFFNAVAVTLVEFIPGIAPVEDEEISGQLERSYRKQGIKVNTGALVNSVDTSGDGCKVAIKTQLGEEFVDCDMVLSAVGVDANIENIGLQEVGIETRDGKVVVDGFYQTSVPCYYAIGDCIPGPALAHAGSAEGILCVEIISGRDVDPLNYLNIPGCTYCSPEVASVGYTETEARQAGYDVKVEKFPFSASVKASAAGHTNGFVQLIFDAKYSELLGGHLVGANVKELIAEVVAMRKLEATGEELINTVHPHPTMCEAIMEAAVAAFDEVIHL